MDKEAAFDKVQSLYEAANKKCFIEPTNIKKYRGSINASKHGCFNVNITHKKLDKTITGSFKNYADAFAFVKATTKKYNLPVRNRIRDHGIYMKVEMTKGRKMIFDHRNLQFVQQHNIHAVKNLSSGDFYACTQAPDENMVIVNKQIHNLIKDHTRADIATGITIDHANRNTEDNREFNLRQATRSVQNINRDHRKDNKTGYKGVFYYNDKRRNYYEAYSKEHGEQQRKCFSIKKYGHDQAKQMAIDCRKQFELTGASYIEAYQTDVKGVHMAEDAVYDISDDLEYDFEHHSQLL